MVALLYVPAPHAVHVVFCRDAQLPRAQHTRAPGGAKALGAQATQGPPGAALTVLAGHAEQLPREVAPRGLLEPAGQLLQLSAAAAAAEALAAEKFPALQHTPAPPAEPLPAAHAVHVVAPASEEVFGAHARQARGDAAPKAELEPTALAFMYRPATQGTHAVPLAQEPGKQHTACVPPELYVPFLHAVQAPSPPSVVLAAVSAPQGAHRALAFVEVVPNAQGAQEAEPSAPAARPAGPARQAEGELAVREGL